MVNLNVFMVEGFAASVEAYGIMVNHNVIVVEPSAALVKASVIMVNFNTIVVKHSTCVEQDDTAAAHIGSALCLSGMPDRLTNPSVCDATVDGERTESRLNKELLCVLEGWNVTQTLRPYRINVISPFHSTSSPPSSQRVCMVYIYTSGGRVWPL